MNLQEHWTDDHLERWRGWGVVMVVCRMMTKSHLFITFEPRIMTKKVIHF